MHFRGVLLDLDGTMVTSEDIQQGKPHPEPFLIGAARLDVSPARCIAFEDSTAGLISASGAGCVVVEVLTRQSSFTTLIPGKPSIAMLA